MNFRADLHVHTTESDGTETPFEVLKLAQKSGLSGLSITDHDTVSAYTEELFQEAKKQNISLITGVEFSAQHHNHSVHILGYGFDLSNPQLHAFCQRHIKRRIDRNLAILRKLEGRGISIKEQELYPTPEHKAKPIGRPHIAQLLVDKGVCSSIQETFKEYIGDHCCCYVAGERPTVQETLQLIHQAGGFAVLAHPHLHRSMKLVKELISFAFDGIEGYYAKLPPSKEAPFVQLATSRNLLVTGGSDYHGAVKQHIQLGCSWVGEATFRKLEEGK